MVKLKPLNFTSSIFKSGYRAHKVRLRHLSNVIISIRTFSQRPYILNCCGFGHYP